MADSDADTIPTLAAARELSPKIRAAADEIEQGRRLPLHLVREMQRAGVQAEAMVSSVAHATHRRNSHRQTRILTGSLPSFKQRARARLAMVHASTVCTRVVELLYKANGGSSVYAGNAFDRRLRDIQAANQHMLASLKTWEVTGRVVLGLEPNYGLLF
jgi:alkylation response protein AidB-like acyl-CoA dehydrogenase